MTDNEIAAEDDPDVIDVHDPSADPSAGPMPFRIGRLGAGVPLGHPTKSTPLDDDEPGTIPAAPLWAMKYRRHFRLRRRPEDEVRVTLGEGDGAVYVIDDGPRRVMISRQVGVSPDGCQYCLVGTLTLAGYEEYSLGGAALGEMFSGARDLALCAVYDAGSDVSNVSLVETFAAADEVPPDYLPPHPLISFDEHQGGDG